MARTETEIIKFIRLVLEEHNDYWSSKISQWFPKPEIVAMASSFGAFEAIHAEAYARLNDELGLDNFQAFMEDEASRNKIERLRRHAVLFSAFFSV